MLFLYQGLGARLCRGPRPSEGLVIEDEDEGSVGSEVPGAPLPLSLVPLLSRVLPASQRDLDISRNSVNVFYSCFSAFMKNEFLVPESSLALIGPFTLFAFFVVLEARFPWQLLPLLVCFKGKTSAHLFHCSPEMSSQS